MKLNLPEIQTKITRRPDGSIAIYDRIRMKYVALTPEEWVRQHFVDFLINCKHYPAGHIANEVSLKLNDTSRRSDTVVYDDRRSPIVIVEYKAPMVAITPKVFDQIARYNSVLRGCILIVSNGLTHFCCRINPATGDYTFLDDIPDYAELKQLFPPNCR